MVLPHSFHGCITFYCSPDYFTMEFYQERNRTNFTAIFSENISEVIIIHLSCNPNGKIWKTHFLWFFLWRVINSFSYHCIHWLFFFSPALLQLDSSTVSPLIFLLGDQRTVQHIQGIFNFLLYFSGPEVSPPFFVFYVVPISELLSVFPLNTWAYL